MQDKTQELRDQFAMAALPNVLPHFDLEDMDAIAQDAYKLADAMIAERAKSQPAETGDAGSQETEGVPREWAIKVTPQNYELINQLSGDLCASYHIGMFAYCFSNNYMQYADESPAECAVITDAHLLRLVLKQK